MKTKTKTKSDKLLSARELLADESNKYVSPTLTIPDDAPIFKLENQKPRLIDIIPHIVGKRNKKPVGDIAICRTYFSHRDVGPNKAVVLCPGTFGKPCPICEEFNSLSFSDKKDIGKGLRQKVRNLWNVIDIHDRKAGIQIWDIAQFNFMDSLNLAIEAITKINDEDPRLCFADPTEGYSLQLSVSEHAGAGFKFLKSDRVDFVERKIQYKQSIKDKAYCLDDVLKAPMSYKDLKNLFHQNVSDGEGDEQDSDSFHSHERNGKSMKRKPVTAKSKGIKVGSTVEHPVLDECAVTEISKDGLTLTLEDAEGDESVVAAVEVELVDKKAKGKGKAKPAKKAPAKKGKKVVDDEEDEDEDEDSEEEDEDEEESDDEEEEEEESEEEEEDEDEDEEEEDEDEEEEEDEAPKKKTKPKAKPKAKARGKK